MEYINIGVDLQKLEKLGVIAAATCGVKDRTVAMQMANTAMREIKKSTKDKSGVPDFASVRK